MGSPNLKGAKTQDAEFRFALLFLFDNSGNETIAHDQNTVCYP